MNNDSIHFRHQMPAQLRFSDVDQFGHVNNSVYFSLFDTCKTKYVMEVVGDEILSRLGTVVASIKADFIAPIYYPDEIVIQTKVTRLGNKSYTVLQRAINKRTLEIKCECHTTMVTYDIHNNKSILIPDDFRQKIECYEDYPYKTL